MVNLVRCTSTLPHRARNPVSELSSTINRPSLISSNAHPCAIHAHCQHEKENKEK